VSYASIKQFFPGKRITGILDRTKANPLSFNVGVVYSYLVYLAAHNKGATQQMIAKATGLDRGTAVANALKTLQANKLAIKTGTYWKAAEPGEETRPWFAYVKGSDEWAWPRRFARWWMCPRTPESELSLKHNALYFALIGARCKTELGLAVMLHLGRNTVRSALKELRRYHLVSEDKLTARAPSDEHMAWWQDKPKRPAFRLSRAVADFSTFGQQGEIVVAYLDGFVPMLKEAGYSQSQMAACFTEALNLAGCSFTVFSDFVHKFKDIFKRADDAYVNNRSKYPRARNSRGWLQREIKKEIGAMMKRRKRA
jgi:hypothetical protein